MRFRYCLDPLFLICLALYVVNRWILKPYAPCEFVKGYLNDLICIPFWVPVMLLVLRKLRLRQDDSPPQWHEIVVPLILWSVVFELWLPHTTAFRGLATSDYRDVVFYSLGAAIAAAWWGRARVAGGR